MTKDEIEWHLQNWALFKGAGGWSSVHSSGDVDPEDLDTRPPPDTPHYREATVPVLGGLARDVDDIVNALPKELYHVIRAYYLGVSPGGEGISLLTMEQTAETYLLCSLATYKRRLIDARTGVGDGLDARQQRMREAREDAETALRGYAAKRDEA